MCCIKDIYSTRVLYNISNRGPCELVSTVIQLTQQFSYCEALIANRSLHAFIFVITFQLFLVACDAQWIILDSLQSFQALVTKIWVIFMNFQPKMAHLSGTRVCKLCSQFVLNLLQDLEKTICEQTCYNLLTYLLQLLRFYIQIRTVLYNLLTSTIVAAITRTLTNVSYTRKNLTTCSKSANKPSTSYVRTACYQGRI